VIFYGDIHNILDIFKVLGFFMLGVTTHYSWLMKYKKPEQWLGFRRYSARLINR